MRLSSFGETVAAMRIADLASRLARHRPLWRVAAFLLLFAALQALYLGPAGRAPEVVLIEALTVPSAAALLGWIAPELGAQARGPELVAPGGGLNVYRGCEGSELLLLWTAAMLVAPIRSVWRAPLLVAGLPLLFLLNQARIVGLFFLHRRQPEWFAPAHDVLLPLLLVLATGALFAFVCRRFAN